MRDNARAYRLIQVFTLTIGFVITLLPCTKAQNAASKNGESLLVRRCNDFTITGNGSDPEWTKTGWATLTKLDPDGPVNESRFKILYSATGIYILFEGQDQKITSQAYADFDNIFNGDVFEVFLHPDPAVNVYFEYEVNHLNKELILAISNLDGHSYNNWIPRNQNGKNRSGIKHLVDIAGGKQELNSAITSWRAELFFPFGALGLFPRVPPVKGTSWNANFCRLDYDSGKMVKWSWSPAIKTSFHELEAFRSITFE